MSVSFLGVTTFLAVLCGFGFITLFAKTKTLERQALLRKRLPLMQKEEEESLLKQDLQVDNLLANSLEESHVDWSVSLFIFYTVGAGFSGMMLGLTFADHIIGIILSLIGAGIPYYHIYTSRKKHRQRCDDLMPQAIELISLSLRTGHSLAKALSLAAKEIQEPLATELTKVVEEHSLGRPLSACMDRLSKRVPNLPTINAFAVAVSTLEMTGGNLISVLDRLSNLGRERKSYKLRLLALTAQGRASAKMLSLMPPILVLLFSYMDEDYANKLFGTLGGLKLLAASAFWWFLGVMVIRNMTKKISDS